MESEQQQQQEEQDITTLPTEEEAQPEATKSVKNFWERLDEVFTQNTELRERMEDLVEQFPTEQRVNTEVYRSFIFQPERINISSNDDIQQDVSPAIPVPYPLNNQGHAPSERFSNFRIRLSRPLRNVKSIQLLSAVIPNATQNIPDEQVFFLYYRLRSIGNGVILGPQYANRGAWSAVTTYYPGDIVSSGGNQYVTKTVSLNNNPASSAVWQQITLPVDLTRPNYYDLNYYRIAYVYFTPTYTWPPEYSPIANINQYLNRTFQDYQDVVDSLNTIAATGYNCAFAGDVSFQYNQVLNKITMVPNNIASGYYYLPCGYLDPNVKDFYELALVNTIFGVPPEDIEVREFFKAVPESLLNFRLGFTWNGIFANPFNSANPWADTQVLAPLYWYMRPQDPGLGAYYPLVFSVNTNIITFNSYPDLVNTSCVRVYADFALGSTQDSLNSTSSTNNSSGGLLSIVPVNTTNLGVGFYQNNFDNPLTKVPQNITEVGINMLTDQGTPFYLPNSATVLLELGITYQ